MTRQLMYYQTGYCNATNYQNPFGKCNIIKGIDRNGHALMSKETPAPVFREILQVLVSKLPPKIFYPSIKINQGTMGNSRGVNGLGKQNASGMVESFFSL
jgi:hypothetical protein